MVGWVCTLSRQRGGLCQLISYCLPAITPPFHTRFWDASQVWHSANYIVSPVSSLLGSPLRAPKGDCKDRTSEGACSLVHASCWLVPHFPQQYLTLAAAVPSCAAAEWGLQLFQHLQNNPHCTPLINTITSHPASTSQRSGFQLGGVHHLSF